MPIIIGIDVGGTNTDAVALDLVLSETKPADSILAHFKAPTTPDVSDGIETAVKEIIANLQPAARDDIAALNLGTTHFINAIVEKDSRKLVRVAVLRLCGPYAKEVPPFAGLPDDLRPLVEGYSTFLQGGLQIDGQVITPVDELEVRSVAKEIKEAGINDIAIVGVYSPIDSVVRQEEHVRDVLLSVLGIGADITLSHDVAGVGFIERENATVLNTAILPFARKTIRGFQKALRRLNISAPLFLTKNDGTLITAEEASTLPITTFLSGPTNSLTGAVFLASGNRGLETGALVLDIGGTTSDVCAVEPSGLPRPAAAFSFLGGVRTNFVVSDLRSIGVGGGSIVRITDSNTVSLGPQSVGKELTTKARVFGGSVLTATDILIAAGVRGIGDNSLVTNIPGSVVAESKLQIKLLLETLIDEMKTSEADIPLILVGGGSIICPDSLDGVSEIIRPPYSYVANAVGAAMAKVSGLVDTIINPTDDKSEEDLVLKVRQQAIAQAQENGAEAPEIVEETILPIPYVNTRSRHVVVRAAGRLSRSRRKLRNVAAPTDHDTDVDEDDNTPDRQPIHSTYDKPSAPPVDIAKYRPLVRNHRWTLSVTDLDFIAEGCGILGCGGGGDTYASHLSVKKLLADGASVEVISSDHLPDDGFIPSVAFMGSPSTFSERLPSGEELKSSVDAVLKCQNRVLSDLTAVMSLEIGGSNGMRGIQAAVWTGKPLVDADLMGRAYPNLWQVTPNNAGISLAPAAASDAKGNTLVQVHANSNKDVEDMLRTVCVQMGQAAGISLGALTGQQVKRNAAQRSVSLSWYLGRAVKIARSEKRDIVDSILSVSPGRKILTGKITRVTRNVRGAFTEGSLDIVPFATSPRLPAVSESPSQPQHIRVTFQNENIHAFNAEGGDTLASVPDLICILDAEDGRALGTQDYRYGLRVHVVALVGSPQWTEGEGLKNGGPEAFGLGIQYVPTALFREPKSVIREFNKNN